MTNRFLPLVALAALSLTASPAFAQTASQAGTSAPSQAPATSTDPLEQKVIENLRSHIGKEPPKDLVARLVQQIRNAPEQAAANRAAAEQHARDIEAKGAAGNGRPIGALEPDVATPKAKVVQLADATSTPKSQRVINEMLRASKRRTRTPAQDARDCAKEARAAEPPAQGALCDPKEHRKRQAATKCVDCPQKA